MSTSTRCISDYWIAIVAKFITFMKITQVTRVMSALSYVVYPVYCFLHITLSTIIYRRGWIPGFYTMQSVIGDDNSCTVVMIVCTAGMVAFGRLIPTALLILPADYCTYPLVDALTFYSNCVCITLYIKCYIMYTDYVANHYE